MVFFLIICDCGSDVDKLEILAMLHILLLPCDHKYSIVIFSTTYCNDIAFEKKANFEEREKRRSSFGKD